MNLSGVPSGEQANTLIRFDPKNSVDKELLTYQGNLNRGGGDVTWCVPKDAFIHTIRKSLRTSKMAGRGDIKRHLYERLELLMLNNDASTTIMEGRSGYGKSHLIKDFVDLTKKLGIRTAFIPAAEDLVSSPLYIWKILVEEILFLVSKETHLTPMHMQETLPSGCGISQSIFLNEILPKKFHFSPQYVYGTERITITRTVSQRSCVTSPTMGVEGGKVRE